VISSTNLYITSSWFQQELYYYICSNIDSETDEGLEKKDHILVEAVLSAVLHALIQARIKLYKCRLPESEQETAKTNLNYLTTFGMYMFVSAWMIAVASIQNIVNSLGSNSNELCTMNNFVITYQFLGPCLTCLFLSSLFYIRHSKLRRTLLREAKNSINAQNTIDCIE